MRQALEKIKFTKKGVIMSYGEENKLSMNKQTGENGAWVKDHLDECDFVIQYFSEKKSADICIF